MARNSTLEKPSYLSGVNGQKLGFRPLSAEIIVYQRLDFQLKPYRRSRFDAGSSLPHRLNPWLRGQTLNVTRHAAALRPFRFDEFGTGEASPSHAHIEAANSTLARLRSRLLEISRQMGVSTEIALESPYPAELEQFLARKESAQAWVRAVEKIWDFYFELFGQRQTRFGNWLMGADRIALDCYQVIYMGLGVAKSIPAPGPYTYVETGFSPASFRRGIPLSKLGKQINLFPLIQLPYHRLVNPWTLGAILHEVSHALQTDLGMRKTLPHAIARRLLKAGMSRAVAKVWTRWNTEIWADLSGLLLGGPEMVGSLMDIAARSPRSSLHFRGSDPHPTPYLRIFINAELLRRLGFPKTARRYVRLWQRLYPNPRAGNIPSQMLATFRQANQLVVDTVCFTPYAELGNKTLAQVIGFQPQHQRAIAEAGKRLAAGNDPGIIPERFLIGASRWAMERQLAEPRVITKNFYRALAKR
ncbi:MAG: hypothetical protein SVX43_14815 [Cyanobacteriota bacterium]|nr:hypothetical protein [Cyanobacteriota bacterium]